MLPFRYAAYSLLGSIKATLDGGHLIFWTTEPAFEGDEAPKVKEYFGLAQSALIYISGKWCSANARITEVLVYAA